MTTLESYVSRMKEGQHGIYFLATNDSKSALMTPYLEKLVTKGYEVLLMTDPLDEYVAMNLSSFKASTNGPENRFIDVTRENLDIFSEEITPNELLEIPPERERLTHFCATIEDILEEKVEKVTLS